MPPERALVTGDQSARSATTELPYEGLRADDALSRRSRQLLLDLIDAHVGRSAPGHAEVKHGRGAAAPGRDLLRLDGRLRRRRVFYYRVHSPVILIEFDHQRGVALDNDEPTRTTSTPSCARPTATTTARTCCASTTPRRAPPLRRQETGGGCTEPSTPGETSPPNPLSGAERGRIGSASRTLLLTGGSVPGTRRMHVSPPLRAGEGVGGEVSPTLACFLTQPFTAPPVRPCASCFWTASPKISTGSMMIALLA